MKHPTLVLAVTALLVALAPTSPADAQTKLQLRCQKAIAKAGNIFAKQVLRAEAECEQDLAESGSCDSGERDATKALAQTKLDRKIRRKCDSSAALTALGFPAACPDADGPPFTVDDVVTCIRDSHLDEAAAAIAAEYPGGGPLADRAVAECQLNIGRSGEKFLRRSLSTRRRCRDLQLRGKVSAGAGCNELETPYGPGTTDSKTDARLGKEGARLSSRLTKKCTGITLEGLGYPGICNDDSGPPFTTTDLVECVRETHADAARVMFAFEYALSPGGVTTTSTTSTTLFHPSTTTTLAPPTTTTTLPLITFEDLADLITPNGDADGDGFSNGVELAACSNPADPASTPANDDGACPNSTIFSDSFGPAWGNTNNMANPVYNAAVGALVAQNTADCAAYCAATPNIGMQGSCQGVWPFSGVPEHGHYDQGETVEVNFPDESGNNLHGTIFLPPGVTCTPTNEPVCDGITDAVTCTAPGGETYPMVVICDGFTGTQRMYYWAGHRLAANGYIAMTFDVSGQGRSQGQFPNPDAGIAADLGGSSGFSRDLATAMNFAVSAGNPVLNLVEVDPLLIVNQATGASDHTETYNLGVAGHSAGATATIAYQQSTETTTYPVRARAGVGWSHFDADGTIGNIPLQLHSGDEDSGFIQPPGSGTTAPEQERRFDRLAGDRDLDSIPDFTPSDRQIIMIEDGTHLTYSQGAWFYYPSWGEEIAYHYTLAWFDKYQRGDVARTMGDVAGGVIQSVDPFVDYAECTPPTPDCYTATERLKMSHAHLSDTWCSRHDIGGDFNGDMKGGGCQTE